MPALLQTLFISLAVVLAYIWLKIPWLAHYSLQAVALFILLYFVLKKLNKAKIWLLASTAVDELSLVTLALLILIGSTGQTDSFFFPLIYIYLFFLIFTTSVSTAIIINLELMLFYYALAQENSLALFSQLLSLPLILVFFLYAKNRYLQVEKDKKIIALEEKTIQKYQEYVKEQQEEIEDLEEKVANAK
ncbi:MAG: hypothetical protein PVJ09_00040 [Candidatus Woesebacteria bacterium]|jgi:hypothetical protein